MNKNGFSPVQLVLVLAILSAIGATFYLVSQNNKSKVQDAPRNSQIAVIQTPQPIPTNTPIIKANNSINTNIEPNVLPSRAGWSIFIFPTGGYSFEFPSDWKIKVIKPRQKEDKFYEVSLLYRENGKERSIRFMIGGHGGFNCDYTKEENKVLGGRTTTWDKCYSNNQYYNSVITFPNKEFENYFIGVEMLYLPVVSQQKYEKIMEEIIGSLKEYPGKNTNL